jgi:hypothetical protein
VPCFFRLARPAPWSVLRRRNTAEPPFIERSFHMDRDGEACLQVAAVLARIGIHYRDTFYDFPGAFFRNEQGHRLAPAPTEGLDAIAPEDVGVLTTRPALDDHAGSDHPDVKNPRGTIESTGTTLERDVNHGLRTFFHTLKPREVALQAGIVLPPGWEHYQGTSFTAHGPVFLQEKEGWTAGYAAYLPRWAFTCGSRRLAARLLAVFAHDGTTGLCWSHLVRRKLAGELLAMLEQPEPRLLIGEFQFRMPAGEVPLDARFVEQFGLRHVVAEVRTAGGGTR